MPQLDINTFIFQYIALITTFLIVYVILSYIVLPQLLRANIIRNTLTKSEKSLTALSPITSYTANNIIKRNITLISTLAAFPVNDDQNTSEFFIGNKNNANSVTTMSAGYTSYLILKLMEEEKEYIND